MLFALSLFIVAAIAVAVYLVVFLGAAPEVANERLGRLEDLPEDLGQWREDTSDAAAAARGRGLVREVRALRHPTRDAWLLHQARLREPGSGRVVEVEPERAVPRRRVPVR